MLQPVSVGLKFGFLAVLYLFLMWVAWSALRDLRRGRGGVIQTDRPAASDATGMYDAADGIGEPDEFEPRLLVEHAAGHESGVAYDLLEGATLGRGDVEIQLEDPFASRDGAAADRRQAPRGRSGRRDHGSQSSV